MTIDDTDLSFVGVNAILTEWRSNHNYATRVSYVTGTPRRAERITRPQRLHCLGPLRTPDTRTGGIGRDLFISALAGLFTDWNNGGSETKVGW